MSETAKSNKRTRLAPAARRSQLLEIGFQLLTDEPLDELTVDRVAAIAGVSRGLVFHYFPTVRELHLACLEMAADDLVTQVGEAAVGDVSADRVRGGLDAFVNYFELQPQTFVAMSSMAAADPDFGEVFERVRSQMVDLIRDRAELPADPMLILMLRSWVSFTENAVLHWVDEAPVSRGELIDILVGVKNDVQERWEAQAAIAASTSP